MSSATWRLSVNAGHERHCRRYRTQQRSAYRQHPPRLAVVASIYVRGDSGSPLTRCLSLIQTPLAWLCNVLRVTEACDPKRDHCLYLLQGPTINPVWDHKLWRILLAVTLVDRDLRFSWPHWPTLASYLALLHRGQTMWVHDPSDVSVGYLVAEKYRTQFPPVWEHFVSGIATFSVRTLNFGTRDSHIWKRRSMIGQWLVFAGVCVGVYSSTWRGKSSLSVQVVTGEQRSAKTFDRKSHEPEWLGGCLGGFCVPKPYCESGLCGMNSNCSPVQDTRDICLAMFDCQASSITVGRRRPASAHTRH